jgi:type III secretion protein V
MSSARGADAALAALVLAIVGMMVIPLPTLLLDGLIAANIALGILLLSTALYMRDALAFAAFPTLILLTTLYRLALNVSSTRLILLQADAGRIIDAFGSFVIRGDYAVGALVFLVLTLIQFIVIARGAERVAEVGARFSLDAMPGKQLAIDADLRAGSLSSEAARSSRKRLESESQLYGAMDGAMKFVKGDAIASIVITLINFTGGVALGATARGLDLETSLKTYGLLTIGDGLVTQIPAILSSTAAGIAVTRVVSERSDGSLGRDIAAQLFGDVRVLFASGLLLTLLALLPGLPAWPFLVLGLGCSVLGMRTLRRGQTPNLIAEERAPATSDERLAISLSDALFRELARSGRAGETLEGATTDAAEALRRQIGLRLPHVALRRDGTLPGRSHQLLARGLPEPVIGHAADTDPRATLSRDLTRCVKLRPELSLELDDVQRMLDALDTTHPALVRHAIPRVIDAPALQKLLRTLAAEGVHVGHLNEILEALCAEAPRAVHELPTSERARAALARRISHGIAPQGSLHVLRLDPMIEEALHDAMRREGDDEWLALPPDLACDIRDAIERSARVAPQPHALVTGAALRRHVRSLIQGTLPELCVLAVHELSPELRLASRHVISP